VTRATDGRQVPWISSSLTNDFRFRIDKPVAGPSSTTAPPIDPLAHDRAFWEQVKDSRNPDELNAYLEQFPKGLFASLARARLKTVAAQTASTPAGTAAPPAPPSGPVAALNIASLPFVSEGAKRRIEREFAAVNKPQKALALTEAGGWGSVNGRVSVEEARAGALDECQKRNPRHPCFVAVVNDGAFVQAGHSPDAVREGAIEIIKRAALEAEVYANEDRDEGIAPTLTRRQRPMHGATPRSHPVAKTITTRQLVELYRSARPLLINVLDWTEGSFALPGSVWIQGMGKSSLAKAETTELRRLLTQIAPDTAAPVVVYCLSWECWLSYNGALTAADLGYKNVYWYRGGVSAWNQARLPVVRTKLLKQL
jgi:PQQ-dependent catabolism-associated CXXCW motif protein